MADVWAKITTQGKAVEITESLGRIDYDNLQAEVAGVSAEGNWWAILAARARKRAKNAAHDTDVLEAQLRKEARVGATGRGEKFTVESIRDEVTVDPRMIAAKRAVAEAEEEAEILDSTKFAIIGKGRLLQEITGLVRDELQARRAALGYPPAAQPTATPPASTGRRRPLRP